MYIWAILVAGGASVHVSFVSTHIIIVLPLDSELLACTEAGAVYYTIA